MNCNVKVKDIRKWVRALRSGKYTQTTSTLQDEKGFCCLGVACSIFIPHKDQINFFGYLKGSMPHEQPYCPEWLQVVNAHFRSIAIGLTDLNDEGFLNEETGEYERLTFDEIADLLEAVYIHKVLEN